MFTGIKVARRWQIQDWISTCENEKQEFRRVVLCRQLWLKTEADEIQNDKNYAGHK